MSETEKNRGGRPRIDATPITVRVPPSQLQPLDAWIANRPDPKPSRPEAIRSLINNALNRDWEPLAFKIKQDQYDELHNWLNENVEGHTKNFDAIRDKGGELNYIVKIWAEPNDLDITRLKWC